MQKLDSPDKQASATEYVVECDGEQHVTGDRAAAVRVANGWLAESRSEAQLHGEWLESIETLVVYERRVIFRARCEDGEMGGRAVADYTLAEEPS